MAAEVLTTTTPPAPSLFRWECGASPTSSPKQPMRRGSLTRRPSFLAKETVGPNRPPPNRRRPPPRSRGFHEATMDVHKIPVTPIEFLGKKKGGPLVQEGMARVLQDIVVDTNKDCGPAADNNKVTVVFAIRVPGCGQCREHRIQLSELAELENVTVKGVGNESFNGQRKVSKR